MNSRTAVALEQATLGVANMVCDGCAERIRNALASLTGVRRAKVGLWLKQVRVSFDPSRLNKAAIIQAHEEAKFNVADAH